jgi:hypothetical protein
MTKYIARDPEIVEKELRKKQLRASNPLLARELYDSNIIIHVAHMGEDTPYVLAFKRRIVQNPENREIVRNHPTLLNNPIVICA